jgi:hypothetical protein
MLAISFFDAKQIPWYPIDLLLHRQKLVSDHTGSYVDSFRNYFLCEEKGEEKKRENQDKPFVIMDTSTWFHIDIDGKNASPLFDVLLRRHPWYPSLTRPWGKHILVRLPEFVQTKTIPMYLFSHRFPSQRVEMLCGVSCFCRR